MITKPFLPKGVAKIYQIKFRVNDATAKEIILAAKIEQETISDYLRIIVARDLIKKGIRKKGLPDVC